MELDKVKRTGFVTMLKKIRKEDGELKSVEDDDDACIDDD